MLKVSFFKELWSGNHPYAEIKFETEVVIQIHNKKLPDFPTVAKRSEFNKDRELVSHLCNLCWNNEPSGRLRSKDLVNMIRYVLISLGNFANGTVSVERVQSSPRLASPVSRSSNHHEQGARIETWCHSVSNDDDVDDEASNDFVTSPLEVSFRRPKLKLTTTPTYGDEDSVYNLSRRRPPGLASSARFRNKSSCKSKHSGMSDETYSSSDEILEFRQKERRARAQHVSGKKYCEDSSDDQKNRHGDSGTMFSPSSISSAGGDEDQEQEKIKILDISALPPPLVTKDIPVQDCCKCDSYNSVVLQQ